uniref:Uncharacterized protein n=1 Tax=Rhizophora mucronata TaxID=61149 RepID=A0A2P2JIT5_RHIMU
MNSQKVFLFYMTRFVIMHLSLSFYLHLYVTLIGDCPLDVHCFLADFD